MLHRLVAQAFIPNPEKKEIVKHLDGDNDNNNVANLYWQSFLEMRELNDQALLAVYKARYEEQLQLMRQQGWTGTWDK